MKRGILGLLNLALAITLFSCGGTATPDDNFFMQGQDTSKTNETADEPKLEDLFSPFTTRDGGKILKSDVAKIAKSFENVLGNREFCKAMVDSIMPDFSKKFTKEEWNGINSTTKSEQDKIIEMMIPQMKSAYIKVKPNFPSFNDTLSMLPAKAKSVLVDGFASGFQTRIPDPVKSRKLAQCLMDKVDSKVTLSNMFNEEELITIQPLITDATVACVGEITE